MFLLCVSVHRGLPPGQGPGAPRLSSGWVAPFGQGPGQGLGPPSQGPGQGPGQGLGSMVKVQPPDQGLGQGPGGPPGQGPGQGLGGPPGQGSGGPPVKVQNGRERGWYASCGHAGGLSC